MKNSPFSPGRLNYHQYSSSLSTEKWASQAESALADWSNTTMVYRQPDSQESNPWSIRACL